MFGLVACTFGSDMAEGDGEATTGTTPGETTTTTSNDTIPFDTGSDGDDDEHDDFPMITGDLQVDETPLRRGESNVFEGAADELWIGNAPHGGDWYGLQYRAMQDELFVLGTVQGC